MRKCKAETTAGKIRYCEKLWNSQEWDSINHYLLKLDKMGINLASAKSWQILEFMRENCFKKFN
jgi:hypothetical protein